MRRKWTDKKVLILGLSKSGAAAAKYLSGKGADCYVTEYNQITEKNREIYEELIKEGIKVETGTHSEEFINDSYIAITSPGIPPKSEIFQRLKEKNISVISEIELAYLEQTEKQQQQCLLHTY